jgi:hypothetical protein
VDLVLGSSSVSGVVANEKAGLRSRFSILVLDFDIGYAYIKDIGEET